MAFTKKKIFKIFTKTNYYEYIRLHDSVQRCGNIFIDTTTFYFIVKPDDKSYSKLAIVTVDMINQAFNEGLR